MIWVAYRRRPCRGVDYKSLLPLAASGNRVALSKSEKEASHGLQREKRVLQPRASGDTQAGRLAGEVERGERGLLSGRPQRMFGPGRTLGRLGARRRRSQCGGSQGRASPPRARALSARQMFSAERPAERVAPWKSAGSLVHAKWGECFRCDLDAQPRSLRQHPRASLERDRRLHDGLTQGVFTAIAFD